MIQLIMMASSAINTLKDEKLIRPSKWLEDHLQTEIAPTGMMCGSRRWALQRVCVEGKHPQQTWEIKLRSDVLATTPGNLVVSPSAGASLQGEVSSS